MMKEGVFSTLSLSYFNAIKNSFYYVGHTHWLLKPFVLPIALGYILILVPCGLIFGVFIVFDWLSNMTDKIRNFFLKFMENQSHYVNNSLFEFLIRPLLLLLTLPLFLLSLILPKFSSNIVVNMAIDEILIDGAGTFKKINKILWRTANRLFLYVTQVFLFLKPVVAIVAVFYSLVLIVTGIVFLILVPLDWLSKLVERTRVLIVRFVQKREENIKYELNSFIIAGCFCTFVLINYFGSEIYYNDGS